MTLERQDRTRWTAAEITEGTGLLEVALRRGRPGPYQVQAAIAACHATAATAADTDWPKIAALYGQLGRLVPSAVVELNRAVAVGMAEGPAAGLALVDALADSGQLDGYHLLPGHPGRSAPTPRAGPGRGGGVPGGARPGHYRQRAPLSLRPCDRDHILSWPCTSRLLPRMVVGSGLRRSGTRSLS